MKKMLPSILMSFFLSSVCARAELVNATYVVAAESYPIADISLIRDAAGSPAISFYLPEDLVGADAPPVVLSGEPSSTPLSFQLSGTGVSALCSVQPETRETSCTLTYARGYLSVDPKSVEKFLSQKYAKNPPLLAEKLIASAHFLTDPKGVLELSFPR
jgi:hypothetical protein